jgi:hypothetical protein
MVSLVRKSINYWRKMRGENLLLDVVTLIPLPAHKISVSLIHLKRGKVLIFTATLIWNLNCSINFE